MASPRRSPHILVCQTLPSLANCTFFSSFCTPFIPQPSPPHSPHYAGLHRRGLAHLVTLASNVSLVPSSRLPLETKEHYAGLRSLPALQTLHHTRCLQLKTVRSMQEYTDAKRSRDDGDWDYSPEWWGPQGGSWACSAGELVYERWSKRGNGLVTVTAHPASTPRAENWPTLERNLLHKLEKGSSLHVNRREQLRVLGSEWRVLRFNDVTWQSVAKVIVVCKERERKQVFLLQQANCLAFEYLKSMVAVGLSTVSIGGLNLELVRKGVQQMRVLCIGLGGGSLPLFLAQNLPGAIVEAVEIDDVVISAATEAMGFPASCLTRNRQTSKPAGTKASSMKAFLHSEELYLKQKPVQIASDVQNVQAVDTVEQHCHQILVDKMEMGEVEEALWGDVAERLFVHEADGEEFLLKASQISKLGAEAAPCYDLVFVDAYDGNDEIPCQLMEKNGTFLNALSLLLNPTHGTVVVNLHTDAPPPSLLERITGAFSPGFDPSLPQGRAVQATCLTYRDALLGASKTESMFVKNTYARSTLIIDNMPHDVLRGGIAFTIAVPWQQNICLTVSKTRMQKIATLNHDEKVVQSGADVARKLLLKGLLGEAKTIQNLLCTSMDLPQRVSRGFCLVH